LKLQRVLKLQNFQLLKLQWKKKKRKLLKLNFYKEFHIILWCRPYVCRAFLFSVT
jgi:hypothetical protein